MAGRIADRLARQEEKLVGRRAEQALFASALDATELPFCVLNVFGPGGIGKSTLLGALAAQCRQKGIPCHRLLAPEIDPTPPGIRAALEMAGALKEEVGRQVVLLDGYEALQALEPFLRTTLLPELPEGTLVVLAGRRPLGTAWRSDPAWSALVRVIPLRNLAPDEARELLEQRGVVERAQETILNQAHGYPLALTLACDLLQQRGESDFLRSPSAPDLVQTLIERFLDEVPSEAHRRVLEAAAILRVTTESALGRLLELEEGEARQLFDWLGSLSLMETARPGVAPHPLVRDALIADLRWRSPERWSELHRRARAYFHARLQSAGEQESQHILADYVFLHRDNPVVSAGFTWQEAGAYPDLIRPDEPERLASWVERFEGAASAARFARWSAHPGATTIVFRGADDGEARGFLLLLDLATTTPSERALDPIAMRAWAHLEKTAPLRPGERATLARFWLDKDTYHAVSPVQSLIFMATVRHQLSTPRLAYSFFPISHPDAWEPIFIYAESERLRAVEGEDEDVPLGIFGHDWRRQPPTEWLHVLGEKEVGGSARPASKPEPYLVLSKEAFDEAVRDALKRLDSPEALAESPLLRSRLVRERLPSLQTETPQRVAALQSLLRETALGLSGSKRRERAYLALLHTYLRPAPSQEKAAERLDLPFSTYRRHLGEGISLLCAQLWLQETGADLK